MANTHTSSLSYQVTTILVALSLVVGVLTAAKLAYNLVRFPDKYPYGGVLPDISLSSSTQPAYFQREEDCSYPQVYYSQDGTPREGTEDEKKISQESQDRCLQSVAQARQQAREQDITVAGFFLLGGVGLLVARHFLMS